MDITNYSQAVSWLESSAEIGLANEKFVKLSFLDSLFFKYSKNYQTQKIAQIASFLSTQSEILENGHEIEVFLSLNNTLMKRCNSYYAPAKSIVKNLERNLVKREIKEDYQHSDNRIAFNKWQKNGLPKEIFIKYPEFFDYLENSGLLSQIKITRDTVIERDGEPCLLVDGEWTTLSDLAQTFEVVYSPRFREKFIVHKETRNIYTYLDNGRGLEKHHPHLDGLKPISNLSEEEFEVTLAKARLFVREGDANLSKEAFEERQKKRVHVIQIISSSVETKNTHFHHLLSQIKHPYFHLISGYETDLKDMPKGVVYGGGFQLMTEEPLLPFTTTQGKFRFPDIYEYKACQNRFVTNIAVTTEELEAFTGYIGRYHKDSINLGERIGFQFAQQNCTSFIRNALNSINICIPSNLALPGLIAEICPEIIRNVGRALIDAKNELKNIPKIIFSPLPEKMRSSIGWLHETIHRWAESFFKTTLALTLVPIHFVIGGENGTGGRAFVSPREKSRILEPPLHNWKNWFKLNSYKYDLPGMLHRWQLKQPSTVVYNDPLKLCIVP